MASSQTPKDTQLPFCDIMSLVPAPLAAMHDGEAAPAPSAFTAPKAVLSSQAVQSPRVPTSPDMPSTFTQRASSPASALPRPARAAPVAGTARPVFAEAPRPNIEDVDSTRPPVSLDDLYAYAGSLKYDMRFDTGARVVVTHRGSVIIDRRSARSTSTATISGDALIAVTRLALTVSCTAQGNVKFTTSLWKDVELGCCQNFSFTQIADALLTL